MVNIGWANLMGAGIVSAIAAEFKPQRETHPDSDRLNDIYGPQQIDAAKLKRATKNARRASRSGDSR